MGDRGEQGGLALSFTALTCFGEGEVSVKLMKRGFASAEMHTDYVFVGRTGPLLVPAAHQRYIECRQKQYKHLSTRMRYNSHTARHFHAQYCKVDLIDLT